MQRIERVERVFWLEMGVLACSAPLLYFPERFPGWARLLALGLLAAGWGLRRIALGRWRAATPATPALDLLILLLPLALWAAPEPLRQRYSWPRAQILLWNYCLFWAVVTHASRSWTLFRLNAVGFFTAATGLALLAPFGIEWLDKFAALRWVVERFPPLLVGVFRGAESGFHPNQVAGTLLYALPLMAALSVAGLRRSGPRGRWLLLPATALVGGVLLLTQSRAALLGLAVSLLVMALLPWRWGRVALVGIGVGLALLLPLMPPMWLDLLNDAPTVAALGGTQSLGFRQRIWTMALWGLADFPFTGMGLGTFREIGPLFYNLDIPPAYDIAHAHNLFLQTGLDFGLLGMVCLIAVYLAAGVQLVGSWASLPQARPWVIGMVGGLVGQLVFAQLDAVALGAKTNVMLWLYFALVFALGNRAAQRRVREGFGGIIDGVNRCAA